MGLANYCKKRDHFEAIGIEGRRYFRGDLDFPCCVCKHNYQPDIAEPCRTCDHNLNAVDAPRRIQRKRSKGWRMPPNTVYVGRPTKFGNWPGMTADQFAWSLQAVLRGEVLCPARIHDHFQRIADSLDELRDHDLACWCRLDTPCHADPLLEFANREK